MILLALDTSGPVCGTAVMKDGELVYESAVNNHFTHSRNLMPMVEEACVRSGIRIGEVDLFAATVGPGSFTGVRLGVEAAKAMAHAGGRRIVPVNALEALARGFEGNGVYVCPILDARAGQVYTALFEGPLMERRMPDTPIAMTEYLEKLSAMEGSFLFTGDGTGSYERMILDWAPLKGRCRVAGPALRSLRPACVAQLAMERKDRAVSWEELEPLYLRPPQAVRQKNLRELGHE